jgi:hypothetical protein
MDDVSVTLKGPNGCALHLVGLLLFLWTWAIVKYCKNEVTTFRELALLLSSGTMPILLGPIKWAIPNPWTWGLGIAHWTRDLWSTASMSNSRLAGRILHSSSFYAARLGSQITQDVLPRMYQFQQIVSFKCMPNSHLYPMVSFSIK